MSAKWRRNKKAKRFNMFRVFKRAKKRNAPGPLRLRGSGTTRRKHQYKYPVRKFSVERKLREPAPLIDVLEGNDDIVVVTEFVGFKKENLRISLKDQRLTLAAENLDRKYRKSLNLPKRVIPSTIRTTYKNGVLEIRARKASEEKSIDKVAG